MGLLVSPSFFLSLCMHFVVLLLVDSVPSPVQFGNETDRLALLAFKADITRDPLGVLNSWNESIHFCQWFGVTCGRRHQRVTRLSLDDAGLTGSISPHIGNLSFLVRLTLTNNGLNHNIPKEIGNLRRLQVMLLHNNSITGEIPANISRCSNLFVLGLDRNWLTGKIPAEMGHLSKLEGLSIAINNLTGVIPATLGNVSSLRILDVSFNNIGGNLPDDLGRLTKLFRIKLTQNRLVGAIPPSVFNISAMTEFSIADNRIQGTLPSNLGFSLPNLAFLGVGSNSLSGSIPSSLSNATNLFYIGVLDNNFTGKMPALDKLRGLWRLGASLNHLGTGEADDLSFLSSLINATNLDALQLSDNGFGGLFPESIANFSIRLAYVTLDDNYLYGSIPRGIGNLVNLQHFSIGENQLEGTIPADFGNLQNLRTLVLGGNRLSGEIPSSFGNLSMLLTLNLTKNNLHGNIPSSLGKCRMLQRLLLGNNFLSGTIPKDVFNVSSLLYIDLYHNNLTGVIPTEIRRLTNLEILDISENMLIGNLPITLDRCVMLVLLYLNGNKFSGNLPSSFDKLRGLEELDISLNDISGKIPDYLQHFHFLRILNISYNDFEGAVPKEGIFSTTAAISLEGNKKLCGGIPDLKLRSCQTKGSVWKKVTPILKVVIPLSFGIVCLLLMMDFVYFHWFKEKKEVQTYTFSGHSLAKLSYGSLVKATDGFSPKNLVGKGGFGSVYKGILDLDQGKTLVAVKVLNLQIRGAARSFIAECEVLKSIKHRNLVNVITACSSIDYKGDDFKALVYEFMINGSLEEWLHPNEEEDNATDEAQSLNLLQRLNIAIDIASAIFYLHQHCSEPIVHCDLKPGNILLDDEMIGHVGDFGLTRFLVDATCNSYANQSTSIGLRGSTGYAAPEYGVGNKASTSGDIYSFGILLLEMFTRRRPTDTLFDGCLTLHNFVKMAMVDSTVENIVDPTLLPQVVMGETSSHIYSSVNQSTASIHKIQECLTSSLIVGLACSEELPRDRPDIKEVYNQLHVIKKTFLETGVRRVRRVELQIDQEQV